MSACESEHTMGMRWSGMRTTLSRTLVLAFFISQSRHVGERWIQMRSRRERTQPRRQQSLWIFSLLDFTHYNTNNASYLNFSTTYDKKVIAKLALVQLHGSSCLGLNHLPITQNQQTFLHIRKQKREKKKLFSHFIL